MLGAVQCSSFVVRAISHANHFQFTIILYEPQMTDLHRRGWVGVCMRLRNVSSILYVLTASVRFFKKQIHPCTDTQAHAGPGFDWRNSGWATRGIGLWPCVRAPFSSLRFSIDYYYFYYYGRWCVLEKRREVVWTRVTNNLYNVELSRCWLLWCDAYTLKLLLSARYCCCWHYWPHNKQCSGKIHFP